MAHRFFIICLLIISSAGILAQEKDSIDFEQQRDRVNQLIEERSKRFGDFDNSIKQKTGVFGIFKTKKDMQKSIDILKSIVIADNKILLETKKLVALKENDQDRLTRIVNEYDMQITAYMATISKLQEENERLNSQLTTTKDHSHRWSFLNYLLLSLLIVVLFLYLKKIYITRKSHK